MTYDAAAVGGCRTGRKQRNMNYALTFRHRVASFWEELYMVGFGSLYLVWFSALLSHFNLAYPEGRPGLAEG